MENNPYSPPTSNVAATDIPAASELASRLDRLWAALIDGIILMIILLPLFFFLGIFKGGDTTFGSSLLMAVLGLAAYLLVNGRLLASSGQTVGKRQLGIRIVSLEGQPVSLKHIVLMRLLPIQVIGLVPFVGSLLGFVDALFVFRGDRRCIHDLIAGTKVVNC